MTTAYADETLEVDVRKDAEDSPRPFHWTVDAYYRAWEAGVFGQDARLELIQGRIVEQMPPSPLHVALSNIIADLLRSLLPSLTVRVEGAVRLDFDGEPIPDISVVNGTNRDYFARHPVPDEVRLLVEVAVSSAEYDLSGKALLYAQAGIGDYWVVLPERQQIVVHRDPTPDGYASVRELTMDDTVSPLVAGNAALAVRDLLGLPQPGNQST